MLNFKLGALALIMSLMGYSQSTISGIVSDENGDPLIGANVQLLPVNQITSTNEAGVFALNNIEEGEYSIAISFVGYYDLSKDLKIAGNQNIDFQLKPNTLLDQEVFVYSTRANSKTPTTFSNVSNREIEERNLGQDLPILLKMTPSVVTTSDAGAGIGYTGLRIRGSDATRINVTMNGVPINDSESHGVYWVNMPDLASSTTDIQIQRGVGTSSNGAASFGASVNMQTDGFSQDFGASLSATVGSFNTSKISGAIESGLLNDHWSVQTRFSKINSDGYIDRSAADLWSYYVSGGYKSDKTLIKAMVFGGREETQQAWYGTPEARLTGDPQSLQEVIDFGGEYATQEQQDNLLNSDRRFNYYLYDNEVDNYAQDHFQLHVSQTLTDRLYFAGALHYTYGRGYFEQFREDDDFTNYNLNSITQDGEEISSGDFVRRRWLDNDFYGFTYSLNYEQNDFSAVLGGGWNKYDGDHFGEIIRSEYFDVNAIPDRYYDGVGEKTDFNVYLKLNKQLGNLNAYADAQVRKIDYTAVGIDNDLSSYDTGGDYTFFNPKFGFTYQLPRNTSLYASYAVANREPVRSDFIDAPAGVTPEHETLHNVEVGVRKSGKKLSYQANYYLMNYQNQLVLIGELNDVGSSVRTNVPNSYRTGIELVGSYALTNAIVWSANATFSQNKIETFVESSTSTAYEDTDISFSPNVIIGSDLKYQANNFTAQVFSKYVGQQFLDNTSNESRAISSYFINDLRLAYALPFVKSLDIDVNLLVNNILNVEYSNNGYTWGYAFEGGAYQQNNYYPQAGINFLAGITIKL
ncbi:MAG: iron complex outermembrane receptor protein [Cyclobacteriaceae bacterium]|jgi:iron complex outermembrane receptor protein